MKVYTKTGDAGETSLFGGKRVFKDDLRVEAYGAIDELNAFIGLLADAADGQSDLQQFLRDALQCRLFDLGAYLAADPEGEFKMDLPLNIQDLETLEQAMDHMSESLPPLRNFILPGGHPTISACHICRTVCRRAERAVVRLHHHTPLHPLAIQYLNRLSDYFFVLSRFLALEMGVEEVIWTKRN